MNNFVFVYEHDTGRVEHTVDGGVTWFELADRFVEFLKGSGFQMTKQEIADYLNEDQLTSEEE